MTTKVLPARAVLIFAVACLCLPAGAQTPPGQPSAPDAPTEEWYSFHGAYTFVEQYHPPFTSPFRGPQSLDPGHRGDETNDLSLFAGLRLLDGLAFYANPEIDQGFGLSNTFGVAGFPSAEAYKVGGVQPYVRLSRAFFRYELALGGDVERVEPGADQFGGTHTTDNIVFTVGKFAVTDIFDTNAYAHDPTSDFLNWAVVDAGAFDYAADSWGYTFGAAAEWTQSWWALRGGVFNLSKQPNMPDVDRDFNQFEVVVEGEERHHVFGADGRLKLLVFNNRGNMANYTAAVAAAAGTGMPPSVAGVRRYSSRPGAALNLEQTITDDLGAFARASLNDGHKEAFDFTDINRSVSGGLSLAGKRWGREDDTVGVAGVLNDISKDARNYLAAGGLGILVGDGALPKAGFEEIAELYYKAAIVTGVDATLDFQHIENPGYDALRGPVEVFGIRLHAEF